MYYYSLNDYLKKTFGCKVYKLSLQSGATCPNRDGTKGFGGCIFCSQRGSGDFAAKDIGNIDRQIEAAKCRVKAKIKTEKYIAYFQSYSATYAPLERLRKAFFAAINKEEIVALSIATRPDCLPNEVLELLCELNKIKPVFVELGLQTIHNKTAEYIRRGYSLDCFDKAVRDLKAIGVNVVVHMIIGLPNETKEMILKTAEYIGKSGADGVKFHLLHVLKNTDLYTEYLKGNVVLPNLEEYTDLLIQCIKIIPPKMVVHRLTGDGDKKLLVAPMWSADKKKVLNYIRKEFERQNLKQGEKFKGS